MRQIVTLSISINMYDVFMVSNDGFGGTVFDIGYHFNLEVCSVV